MLQLVLEALESAFGPDHLVTLLRLGMLAGVLERKGRHNKAEAICRRASEGSEKVLGRIIPTLLPASAG